MNNKRTRVVVTRADRAKAIRAAVRDDSKVRVSLNGTRKVGPASESKRPNQ